ncbi:MAG: pseudouridine synthase, partial [Sedimenticola sp.]
RPAATRAELIAYDAAGDRSLLDITIDTGRKHQIRRHLSGNGYPVVGDRFYGRNTDREDLQLTAYHLSFICPISHQEKIFELPEVLLPSLAGANQSAHLSPP